MWITKTLLASINILANNVRQGIVSDSKYSMKTILLWHVSRLTVRSKTFCRLYQRIDLYHPLVKSADDKFMIFFSYFSKKKKKKKKKTFLCCDSSFFVCVFFFFFFFFFFFSSRKHAWIILTPLTPLLYCKTGVYRGIHYFSYFCSKT